MTDIVIRNIISAKFSRKYGKYRVELMLEEEEGKKVCWLSEKQMSLLDAHFGFTKKGYSTSTKSVIGYFNDNGYYAYSKFVEKEKVKTFKEPAKQDLSDLVEED